MTSEHQRGYWEAKLLLHRQLEHRHKREADEAKEHLRVFYPESHLISGGKSDGKA